VVYGYFAAQNQYRATMKFLVRLAALHDVPVLTQLFNSDTRIFGENTIGFGETDIREYITDAKKKVFVCESDGMLVGALMADYHETYSHLETLIVSKPVQQRGVGSLLFDHYEKDLEALKIPLVEVLTEADNTVMQKILEERGFGKGNTFVFYSKWM
jgi:ribosomal protein S18 acetylase RimI-like enzyme